MKSRSTRYKGTPEGDIKTVKALAAYNAIILSVFLIGTIIGILAVIIYVIPAIEQASTMFDSLPF